MFTESSTPKPPEPHAGPSPVLVAAFAGPYSLEAAVQELRRRGVPAESIGTSTGELGHLLSVLALNDGVEAIVYALRTQGALRLGSPADLGLDCRQTPHPGAREHQGLKLPLGREFPATQRPPALAQGRMQPVRWPVTERLSSFCEVERGLDQNQALREARRCLHCPQPRCVAGCPAGNDIPGFIRALRDGKFQEGLSVLQRTCTFPAICGRVCDVGRQCEGACALGLEGEPVAISALERFLGDWAISQGVRGVAQPARTGAPVAIAGAGPAGLAAAAYLASRSHPVTIFEALPVLGGAMAWGIPTFRLPQEVLQAEVGCVLALGVDVRLGTALGPGVTTRHLLGQGYGAVLLAAGTSAPIPVQLPGKELSQVYTGTEFLTRAKLPRCYPHLGVQALEPGQRLVVVGGGNTAVDVARTALRLGWTAVALVYRRSLEEMPAQRGEIAGAREEGVEFHTHSLPLRIQADSQGRVAAVECVRTRPGKRDGSGRRQPLPCPGTGYSLAADTVVLALGYARDPTLSGALPGGASQGNNQLVTSPPATGRTRWAGIWAAGDVTTGAGTVVAAMASGRRTAEDIHRSLKGGRP